MSLITGKIVNNAIFSFLQLWLQDTCFIQEKKKKKGLNWKTLLLPPLITTSLKSMVQNAFRWGSASEGWAKSEERKQSSWRGKGRSRAARTPLCPPPPAPRFYLAGTGMVQTREWGQSNLATLSTGYFESLRVTSVESLQSCENTYVKILSERNRWSWLPKNWQNSHIKNLKLHFHPKWSNRNQIYHPTWNS